MIKDDWDYGEEVRVGSFPLTHFRVEYCLCLAIE